jgi:ankyrin repeat protein
MSLSKERVFAMVVVAAVLAAACSSPAAKSKAELRRRGYGFTEGAFLERVEAGDLESVKLFLTAGISPDAAADGASALLEAARRGHDAVAAELVKGGARVDTEDAYGVTALMFSLITGSAEAAKALLDGGADLNARDVDGRTALIEALTTENDLPPEIIMDLIHRRADVNVRTAGGVTPLMIAVYGDPAVVKALVAAGADVNARDENGASVLRMAKDNPENAKILKDAGAIESGGKRGRA